MNFLRNDGKGEKNICAWVRKRGKVCVSSYWIVWQGFWENSLYINNGSLFFYLAGSAFSLIRCFSVTCLFFGLFWGIFFPLRYKLSLQLFNGSYFYPRNWDEYIGILEYSLEYSDFWSFLFLLIQGCIWVKPILVFIYIY